MSDEQLEQEYQRILAEEREKGTVEEGSPGAERRRHPRLKVNPGDLPVEIDPWVFAIDISISGMAFYSEEAVSAGEIVNISLGDTDSVVEARVLDSDLEESDIPYQPSRYRLHCEFADEEKGMEFLVKIKEMENSDS